MRDPDLMQRADRAAGALEQAWERWRVMHGLGSEPLPPVSSYVGYSLEEPWGQPRVVFGLRADEAELLASMLDGHDCVGPIYATVSARPERRQADGTAGAPSRSYSVPPQAPPPDADQLPSPGQGASPLSDEPRVAGPDEPRAARDYGHRDDGAGHEVADEPASGSEPADEVGEPRSRGAEPAGSDAATEDPSALLTPLPDFADIRYESAEQADGDLAGEGAASGPTEVPAQGPGYRGPRYQGFPPRYDAGSGSKRAAEDSGEDDAADDDAGADPRRRPQVAKLSRTSRRRTSRS